MSEYNSYPELRLGAVPGITAVLHTWGQRLNYHVHLNCIVSGRGLTTLGRAERLVKRKFDKEYYCIALS